MQLNRINLSSASPASRELAAAVADWCVLPCAAVCRRKRSRLMARRWWRLGDGGRRAVAHPCAGGGALVRRRLCAGAGAEARLQRAGPEAHRRRPASGGGGSSPATGEQGQPDEASVRAFAGGGATASGAGLRASWGRASGTECFVWAGPYPTD